jgi:hypothetical protein
MPQPLPEISRTRCQAPIAQGCSSPTLKDRLTLSGLFQTSPNHFPDSVPTELHCPEDFRTKSTGGGRPLPHLAPFTLNLEPNTSNLTASPLPLSTVFVSNRSRPAWPDRWFFCCTIQDGQQGPQALCRGVSGGWKFDSLPYLPSCLPAEVAGQFRSIGELDNARNYHPSMSHMQEPELLHHEEQEDHDRTS